MGAATALPCSSLSLFIFSPSGIAESPFHKQTADAKTFDFLQELRKVRGNDDGEGRQGTCESKSVHWAPQGIGPMLNFLSLPIPPPFLLTLNSSQHVKVGIVGGSDLVKISEQLGENSEWLFYRERERGGKKKPFGGFHLACFAPLSFSSSASLSQPCSLFPKTSKT